MNIKKASVQLSFTVLYLLLLHSAIANLPFTDSIERPVKPHKLTQQQFLDKHGTDPTSRALIRYSYPKHLSNKILTLYFGATMVVSGGLAGLIVLLFEWNIVTFLAAISLGAAAYIAAGIFVVAGIFLLLNSRRRLYRWLQQYHQTGEPPERIRRKKAFLRLLKLN